MKAEVLFNLRGLVPEVFTYYYSINSYVDTSSTSLINKQLNYLKSRPMSDKLYILCCIHHWALLVRDPSMFE